jgi:hypothetical protein
MNRRNTMISSLLTVALLAAGAAAVAAPRHLQHAAGNGAGGPRHISLEVDTTSGSASDLALDAAASPAEEEVAGLDFNEETHLVFMREEEKLARDVYLFLGAMYPDSSTFGNIDDSEQRHTDAVRERLLHYGIADPSSNDNPGVFTGEEYGDYFTEKYGELTAWGSRSELDALHVGAFIEELDMQDINKCPKIVQQLNDGIDSEYDCGLVYTDNDDIQRLYGALLDGSENHLRAYVRQIEAVLGEGSYVAQYLTQEEVDAILGR